MTCNLQCSKQFAPQIKRTKKNQIFRIHFFCLLSPSSSHMSSLPLFLVSSCRRFFPPLLDSPLLGGVEVRGKLSSTVSSLFRLYGAAIGEKHIDKEE